MVIRITDINIKWYQFFLKLKSAIHQLPRKFESAVLRTEVRDLPGNLFLNELFVVFVKLNFKSSTFNFMVVFLVTKLNVYYLYTIFLISRDLSLELIISRRLKNVYDVSQMPHITEFRKRFESCLLVGSV